MREDLMPLDTPLPRVIPSDFTKKNRIEGRDSGTRGDTKKDYNNSFNFIAISVTRMAYPHSLSYHERI